MTHRVGVRRHLLTLGILLSLTSACAGTASKASDAAADPTTASSAGATPANPTVEVPQLLQFTAPLVGGGEFDGASYAGRATAFWFWAPT
ncbi:hypothetical protein BH10ACT2_BH10ACT2_15500 [soil metagenome]